MTTYVEVAQALVTAGYLSDADVQAAVDVLTDALTIQAAEDLQDAASDDYSAQEDIVAEAENWEVEDSEFGDYDDMEDDEDVIDDAQYQEEVDKEIMVEAQAEIDAAYADAASALLAAELIDEANLDDVVTVIADVWVVEED
jgi:hypothetical protein